MTEPIFSDTLRDIAVLKKTTIAHKKGNPSMNKRQLITLASLTTVSLLLIAVLLVVGLNSPVVQAQTQPTTDLARTITVVGEGQITLEPDIAQTNIGVDVIAPTVDEASTQAAATMEAVLAALKAQDIADRDIQTTGYNVWVERPYGPEGPTDTTLYHVGNSMMVTIRDLDKVGSILDAAIEAGANNIYGVTFSMADPNALKGEAREKAVSDALAKAQELAELNQVELGTVISVSEVIGGNGGYYPGGYGPFFGQAVGLGGGGGGPIVPGELNLTVQLQVTYAIE
jgi:hypothetical protein